MLTQIMTHEDYLSSLQTELKTFPLEVIELHAQDILVFQMLDLDPAIPLLQSIYSHTGRPSQDPTVMFRCLFLASRNSWNNTNLHKQLRGNRFLRALCGVPSREKVPGVSTFYDFLHRVVPISEKAQMRKPFQRKSKKKKDIGTDGKLKDTRSTQRTTKLTEKILDQKVALSQTPDRLLQLIFKEVAIRPSLAVGLISPHPVVSADGTCLRTGASSRGVKICDCLKKGIYNCQCKRKFPDSLASIGWDSYTKSWYYGYTAFFLTTYSTEYKKDLPLSIRLLDAKRHDSLCALLALEEFRELYPELKMSAFLADSAMDNHPTYYLLNEWEIPAIIDLNNRAKNPANTADISFDGVGTPICSAGLPMSYNGKWQDRNRMSTRIKFRCPAKTRKTCTCPLEKPCSDKAYGRVVYGNSKDNLRLYTKIPRQSSQWKQLFKQRTATERINKQVLIDHGLENMKIRSKHRNFFFCVMACIDIHMKAQVSITQNKTA